MSRLLETVDGEVTGVIPNNLYANEMRMSMENKNLLSEKGSIYVGTGETNVAIVPDGTPETTEGNSNVVKTMALLAGAEGQILTVDPDVDCGLKWETVIQQIQIGNGDYPWTEIENPDFKYSCTIAGDKYKHKRGANIITQLVNGNTARVRQINTTIDFNSENGTIIVYSNTNGILPTLLIISF